MRTHPTKQVSIYSTILKTTVVPLALAWTSLLTGFDWGKPPLYFTQ